MGEKAMIREKEGEREGEGVCIIRAWTTIYNMWIKISTYFISMKLAITSKYRQICKSTYQDLRFTSTPAK